MATIFPELSDAQLRDIPSPAEAKVYRAFRDHLPNDFVVFFQVGWVLKLEDAEAKDGETDFLICHPVLGYLCVEVKGGGIAFDAPTGEWTSVDRQGLAHPIKNPAQQALRAKYSVTRKLQEHPKWFGLGIRYPLRGHAVFFPDIKKTNALIRPDLPEELIGTAADLESPHEWLKSIFDYWRNQSKAFDPLGRAGLDVCRDVFAKSFSVPPLASARLAEQEVRRVVLTKDQTRILDFLRSHRRVAVSGGAGTGKTILAMEKARRLAQEGFRTLLTCYNRQLADHLASLCLGQRNLEVMNFHQLCYRQVERAARRSARDLLAEAKVTYPGADLYNVQLPNALAYSLEVLEDRYDAIVCDEGQDFGAEYWVPLELMLTDYTSSPLYIFYDDNQDLYTRASTFPISDAPFSLTTNCRNTAPIHLAAYRHYKGVPVTPPEIEGDDVSLCAISGIKAQSKAIHERITDLIARQGVEPGDIVVLVADSVRKADYYAALRKLPLPHRTAWAEEAPPRAREVRFDTVQRFKGLESSIAVLWGLDFIDLEQRAELLYVGMSRAKSLLYVVAAPETCERLARLGHGDVRSSVKESTQPIEP